MFTDCVVTKADRRRLGSLLTTREGRAWGTLYTVGELETLLEDAAAVSAADVPETLVTMNSTVRITNLDSGEQRTVTLVYPQETEESADAISVTDPLGIALLGCQVGEVVQSLDDSLEESFRVTELLFQPEQALSTTANSR